MLTAWNTPKLTNIQLGVATPSLRMVYLDRSGITSIAPMSKMPGLGYLSFPETKATDVRSLLALSNVESLTIPAAVSDADLAALQSKFGRDKVIRFGRPAPGTPKPVPIP